jgi:NADH dehydrogenase/NADH:ubiquinone oxidoreductase subunit G
MASITVDDKKLAADHGDNLLQVCLANGIYIPNLCYLDGMDQPPASCRLCFVEVEGLDAPVAACRVAVRDGMVVTTGSNSVRRLQRAALHLLLSAHDVDCRNCPANRNCALQEMAKFLKVALKAKHLDRFLKDTALDPAHPCLDYFPNRCVLCGRCVAVCKSVPGGGSLNVAWRGKDTVIAYHDPSGNTEGVCPECRRCEEVCPVGALVMRPELSSGQ